MLVGIYIQFIFNPLTPTSDQDRVSPYTSDTTWSRQVMRKKKIKIMDYKLILYQFLQTHHTSERQQGELLIRLWE